MAVNFPNAPTPGQTFISGKTLWTYTNGAWRASPLPTALPFNYIVNPSMVVSQQNGTTSGGAATNYYPADQWFFSWTGAPTNKSAQLTSLVAAQGPPHGSLFAILFNADNGP